MADPLGKVQSGQPLRISAAAWNEVVEAAAWVRGQRGGAAGGALPAVRFNTAGLVWCKNTTGGTLDRHTAAGIGGLVTSPADSENGFLAGPCLTLVTIDADQHWGHFAVAAVPMAADAFGWCWVSGVCPAKIDFDSLQHVYADVQAGSVNLLAALAGTAEILWHPSAPGDGQLSLVRLASPCPVWYEATLTGDLASGGTADATVTTPRGDVTQAVIDLYLSAGQKVSSGSSVGITWERVGRQWVLTDASCLDVVAQEGGYY